MSFGVSSDKMWNCRAAVLVFMLSSSALCSAASAFTSTKVKLNQDAILHCYQSCSGLLTWREFRFGKPGDVVAQCSQTSCWSQEGFQISYDQYLKGNLSLTVKSADFSKRTWYSCICGTEICRVSLRLEPFNLSIPIKLGESLNLDLGISELVEVFFNSAGNASTNSVSVFKVNERKIECDPEYKKRVSLILQLKEVKRSDIGVYTIMDTLNKEVIGTYTVVNKVEEHTDPGDAIPPKVDAQPHHVMTIIVSVLLVLALPGNVLLVRKILCEQRSQHSQMRMGNVLVPHPVMETESEQVNNVQKLQDDKGKESDPLLHHTENFSPVSPVMKEPQPGLVDMDQTERQREADDGPDVEQRFIERVGSPENLQPVTEEPRLSQPVCDSSRQTQNIKLDSTVKSF